MPRLHIKSYNGTQVSYTVKFFSLHPLRVDTWYRLEKRKDLPVFSPSTVLKTHTVLNNALMRLNKIKRTLLTSVDLYLEKSYFLRIILKELTKWHCENICYGDSCNVADIDVYVYDDFLSSYFYESKECFYTSIWNICYIMLKKRYYNFYCQ